MMMAEKEEKKNKVLIIGATGYIGRRLVKASIAGGHQTFVLYRPENVSDVDRCQLFMSFKMQGARLLLGSLGDQRSLVNALKQVDVVVCSIAGDRILEQLKLIEAIKEAGNIKRYLPSEFGMDADRMGHAISPGNQIFADKQVVRRAIEAAKIPYTYVSANCFAGVFLAGLAQLATFMPPMDHVNIYGDGDNKCIWVDEEDVATYAILAAGDERAENKVIYIRPPSNILSQMEVVKIWEKIIGKELSKTFVSSQDWLSSMHEFPLYEQIAVAHMYQIFHCGDLDFEPDDRHGLDAGDLFPDYKYVTVEEYLLRFA